MKGINDHCNICTHRNERAAHRYTHGSAPSLCPSATPNNMRRQINAGAVVAICRYNKGKWYHNIRSQAILRTPILARNPSHSSDLVKISLGPAHTRVMRKVGLDKVRKLRVHVERVRDLGHACNLLLLLLALLLPEPLPLRLA